MGSKSGLLHLVFDRAITVGLESLASMTRTGSPADRLEALIRLQVELIAADPNLFQVFFGHRNYLTDDAKADMRRKEQRYLRLFAEVVSDAIAAGDLRPWTRATAPKPSSA